MEKNSQESGDGDFTITARFVADVIAALDDGVRDRTRALVDPLRPADLADLMGLIDRDEMAELLAVLGDDLDPEVLSELDEHVRDDILEILDPKDVAAAITELDTDDAVYVLEDLGQAEQQKILQQMPAVDRAAVEEALQYPEDSAGRLMQRDLIGVPSFWTVGQVIDYMRETKDLPDDFYEVFVVSPAFHPTGTIALGQLLRSQRGTLIEDIADTDLDTIDVMMDQEDIAYRFEQYGLVSAPVVDAAGRLVGVIMADDVFSIISEEAEEDIKRLAGIGEDAEISDTVLETTRYRFPWLFVNLLTAIAASAVIAMFEDLIEKVVALAVLMPIVASMGGNAGTQSLTVAVRALATKDLTSANARRVVYREGAVGALNGFGFAIILGIAGGWWAGSAMIGMVLAVAMVVNMLSAGLAGILIPLALEKAGADPAVSSSVFVTTVTDVIGFFAFLGLAAMVLL